MESAAEDRRWMSLALTLGARRLGRVWPNPAVGCVLVRDGRVIGRGWTQDGGRPHGEVMALCGAGDLAKGATAYVTLEPCAHHGQTPPCAAALIEAGVARVVIATRDPDPRVNGQGVAMLAEAGIAVSEGVLESDACTAHAGFFKRVQAGQPMVTLKLATSIDGRIATGSGDSQWITGPEARRRVHLLRSCHDAVLIGGGTARDDLPSLTVRGLGPMPNPVRVVLSNRLDLPQNGPLAESAGAVPVWLMHGAGAPEARLAFWREAGARCFEVPTLPGGALHIEDVLARCAGEGLTRVFCEGGGQVAASLLQAGAVDRFVQFIGGVTIGAEGRPGIGALGLAQLVDAEAFELARCTQVGGDAELLWTRKASDPTEKPLRA